MTGGQIAALIFALLLLLPGGCFLYVGIGLMGESHMRVAAEQMLIVGIVILALIGLLFWIAFRKRRPPPPSPGAGS
jgi:membrane protein implicated in regulation of membrane protease activity